MTTEQENALEVSEYVKSLISRLKDASDKKKQAELTYDAIAKEHAIIEEEARKYLEDVGFKKTGEVPGLGWITLADQKLSASVEEGMADEVMEYVRGIGREDLIKTSINASTLASFVDQCLKANQPVPPHVNYFRPKKAKFYPSKS